MAEFSRAQFLRLAGAAVAVTGVAACSDGGTASGERFLIDNVRGYTIAGGKLRRFSSLLTDAAGKVAALDAGNTDGATRIDGRGRICLPGLHDAHCHVLSFGATVTQVDLSATKSLDEALRTLRDYAAKNPDQEWIVGGGWNEVVWQLGRLPTAADLDTVVSDRPVWLERVDGHAGVTNAIGLRATKVTATTPDPEGGRIVRDAAGQATGVFVDAAMSLVADLLPAPTEKDHRQRLLAAQERLNKVGLTSVSDAGTDADELPVLMAEAESLTLRINAFLSWDAFTSVGESARADSVANDRLRVRTVKLYIDGALGSRGAALLAPYLDAPDTVGLPQMSQEELNDRVRQVIAAGYQCAVHAIGDKGNRMVLDAYETALDTTAPKPLRHRIEHAQVVAVEDIPRFASLGLIASMQPVHATDDMNMAEARVGPVRIAGAYAWRTILDNGVVIASGSDFPVSSENPFEGMHAAITRTDREGKPTGGWYPAQAMTPVEALRSFTLDAAFAAHQEKVLGTLEPGKWADFVLVDLDPFAEQPSKPLWQTEVLQTWVGGKRAGEYGQL